MYLFRFSKFYKEKWVGIRALLEWRGQQFPLFFAVPLKYDSLLSDVLDAFVIALLLPAMRCGCEMRIAGPVSLELSGQVEKLQGLWRMVYPTLSPISVEFEHVISSSLSGGSQAAFFQLDVESFHTLHEAGPSHVDYFLSLSSEQEGVSEEYLRAMEDVARCHGAEVVFCKSSFPDCLGTPNFNMEKIAFAYGLAKGLGKVWIPSSHAFGDSRAWGVSALIERILSTQNLALEHCGIS